jgi:hypothetical protein
MTRLMKRLRRRGRQARSTWRIVCYSGGEVYVVVELVRRSRPTWKARAWMGEAFTHVEIERVG